MKRALCLLLLFCLAAALAAEDAAKVDVVLDEYTIDMPHELPPGPTTFVLRNEGQKTHSFKIKGPGLDVMLEASVRPKATQTLQVTLEPGEYDVICPLGSHAAKGMTMKLKVAVRAPKA
jgi:uncharacterized cupredoxin-like copper-binding protein